MENENIENVEEMETDTEEATDDVVHDQESMEVSIPPSDLEDSEADLLESSDEALSSGSDMEDDDIEQDASSDAEDVAADVSAADYSGSLVEIQQTLNHTTGIWLLAHGGDRFGDYPELLLPVFEALLLNEEKYMYRRTVRHERSCN